MNEAKRTRSTRSKLQKGQLASGAEYYYSRKPSAKRADFVVTKAKKPAVAKARLVQSKKR